MLIPEPFDGLDDVSMHECLGTRGPPWGLDSFPAMHANASLDEPVGRVSTSDQMKVLSHGCNIICSVDTWPRRSSPRPVGRHPAGEP